MNRLLGLLCAALLAFAPTFAAASVTTTGAGKAPAAVAGYTGPGDVVSGAKAFYGLRAYSAAIAAAGTQKLVNITRASDSMSCDVLVATSGDIGNVATTGGCTFSGAASAFCNATTCSINIWYDQISAGTFDAGNSGTAPTLVFNCVGTKPCAVFGGAGGMLAASSTATSTDLTISAVALRTSGATESDIFVSVQGAYFLAGNQVAAYFGTQTTATQTDTAWHAMQFVASSGTPGINVDGTFAGGSMGTTALAAPYYIGRKSGGSFLTGKISEVGLWPVAFSGTQQTNMNSNQHTYWGF